MIVDGVLWMISMSQFRECYDCWRRPLGDVDGSVEGGV